MLHSFCYELINDVAAKHDTYYSGSNPAFVVDNNVLGNVISSAGLNDRVRDKIHMTLRLDTRYSKLANSVAHLCYEHYSSNYSFSINEITKVIKVDKVLCEYSTEAIKSLLDEMCEMGILFTSAIDDEPLYRFRKNSFLKMIGSEDDVDNALLGES